MSKLKVYNQQGKEVESVEFDTKIFDGKVNSALLHQATVMYQANLRRGSHSTKTRSDVSGGGKKPWRQKGTGRARVGTIRSPLWRHGGIIFGPHPRSYNFNLSQRVRAKALQSSINARLKENALVILDDINTNIKKTKEFNNILKNLKLKERCLLLLDDSNVILMNAARNIPSIVIKKYNNVNALDIIANKKILMTKKTFLDLEKRLKNTIG